MNDDLCGFFHWWLLEFAKRFETIYVVCLEEGEHDLPENVRVMSLGKENLKLRTQNSELRNRLFYIFGFYRSLWQLRGKYEAVFVHMNKEYMVLGGLWWRLSGVRSVMWYNHQLGDRLARLAGMLAGKILYTSPRSFFAKYEKGRRMPAGVDAEMFKPRDEGARVAGSILSLGRISPIKDIATLLRAVKVLLSRGRETSLRIVGAPGVGDQSYFEAMVELANELGVGKRTAFSGSAPHPTIPAIYASSDIFVNLSAPGLFDKTVLEAAACGAIPIVSNPAFFDGWPEDLKSHLVFAAGNPNDLAAKIDYWLSLDTGEKAKARQQIRDHMVGNHGTIKLLDRIVLELSKGH